MNGISRILEGFQSADRTAQPRRVTIISPHFDDVPLSLGESLRSGSLSRHDVRVRVVFGQSNWSSLIHPSPSRTPYVSLWRRVEETMAGLFFGYRWSAANWEEVLLRVGQEHSASILDPAVDLANEPLVGEIARWLIAVSRADSGAHRNDGPPELILVNAGLGSHLDHRIVSQAAASVLAKTDVPFGFYEDRPYTVYLDADERSAQIARLGQRMERCEVSDAVRRSTQLWSRAFYPSQMSPFFEEAMVLDTKDGATESIWFPTGTRPSWL